ncbi:DNA (cytosine-5-)-methyltransferase (plasmid) [Azospirillum sp. TSH58]|uniref:DNA cytosine methyltransferase n=1 Tax=Azospirillum sp. TSH58 TaxID=664962 RepID=UPI000D6011E7|nr:DNA cytosine methyltransferase [Azospirillum sp. TSH58]AWJ87746.1 DNA (cytosine-5-)-methyltransferase [Azospirillum sp. TSH58]AWJ87776.1 DNA (cytosine-5-)-methyltransferase [Azospirillum sp. TSH58]PWC62122.1 cytosine methyltransferase [Azospirillum sp. TSH58]
MPDFYEFFAGGGMARAGLSDGWTCRFANDYDLMKAAAYRSNWPSEELLVEDINKVEIAQLPGRADLAWASFPCQDLSLAGNYEGIGHRAAKKQTRSGTFWPFWDLMRSLIEEGRGPRIIALENVYGALTSNTGRDFAAIASAFSGAGYRFGGMVIDAVHFVPQSRPRLFIIGVSGDVALPPSLKVEVPNELWHPETLIEAYRRLSSEARRRWIWWSLPKPAPRTLRFVDLIEENPEGVEWHTPGETAYLLSLMSPLHLAKVEKAKKMGRRMVGGVYRRTRKDDDGAKCQRAEVRFDDVAGCLRTPAGGSSRQTILLVEGDRIRSRLLSPREAARLMGLPDAYRLPKRYNDAYHLAGDGVVVPVVRHLAAHILEPLLAADRPRTADVVPIAAE